jgi:AcrR family transcriptional regulator
MALSVANGGRDPAASWLDGQLASGPMEAASTALGGDKAQRIVDAMRASVATRGAAGSTFDHVAREAGVSRGLLHYYFGTKERLLAEVVRRDSDLRLAALDEALASAHTAEDLLEVLVRSLEGLVERDPAFVALHFELFTSARRTPEIAAELAALHRRIREHVAAQLDAKRAEGVIGPGADPEAVVTVLLSLADGLALRMLADPEHDWGPTLAAAMTAARALLT